MALRTIDQVKTDLKAKLAATLAKPYKDITSAELWTADIIDASLLGRGAISSLIREKEDEESDVLKVDEMKTRYGVWQGKGFPASDLDDGNSFKAVQ